MEKGGRMRKGTTALSCLMSVCLLATAARAHVCDDVWRDVDKLVLKPDVTNLVVRDRASFKVYMQNNMNSTLVPTMRLVGTSPAFYVTVTPQQGYGPVAPGERYEYTVTLKVKEGQSSGKYPLTFRLVGSVHKHSRAITTLRMDAVREEAHPPTRRRRFLVPDWKAAGPPTIDGRLEEACWQRALQCGGFSRAGGQRAQRGTQVLLGALPQTLYLGLGCQWRADEAQGRTDALTIHLAHPDPEVVRVAITVESGGRVRVLETIGGEESKRSETQRRLGPAEAGLQVAVLRTPAAWFAEVAVPAPLLGGVTFADGCLADFVRESQMEPAETTYWQPRPTDYVEPSRFAELRFSR